MHGGERVPAMQNDIVCPMCRARLLVPDGLEERLYSCPRCRTEIVAYSERAGAASVEDPFATESAIARIPLPVQEPLDFNRLDRRCSPAERYLNEKRWVEADAALQFFLIAGGFGFAGFVLVLLTCALR